MNDLEARVAKLEAMVAQLLSENRTASPLAVAPVEAGDLDSEWGNFAIKRDPPRWKGQSFVGQRLSQTTPEYLEVLASFCLWKAGRDEQEGTPEKLKYARYERLE